MKIFFYSLAILVAVPAAALAVMSLTAREPKAGLVDNKLRPCPHSPNCVVSENEAPASRIEPLAFKGTSDKAWQALKLAVEGNGGFIREERAGYLWATYTSRIFRFVDDVEFRLDAARGVIHVRSASRAGHSDLGVNRKRIEKLRIAFEVSLK
jgi:uncharacterized protein (DUF1499 family)